MISELNKNNKVSKHSNSLNVSYMRNVNIIFGHYPYLDIIHNFILDIKNNLDSSMDNYTNVKGGMTGWHYFVDKPNFVNFMTFLINKHQETHPEIFEYFLERKNVQDAWGNEIKKGDRLEWHMHSFLHGVLYLTKGCDLILPELNLKITPEPGDYYIFPPEIMHGFDESKEDFNRYSLIFNIVPKDVFKYNKKLRTIRSRS